MQISRCAARCVALLAAILAFPAMAEVSLRVEARPIAEPIQAFVTVTDDVTGDRVAGLTAADFTVTLDGVAVPLDPSDLTLPPSQDLNQKVSVVFAMDYTSSVTVIALQPMQDAVIAFIATMKAGDYAAIIKFNNTNGAVVVQAFTQIDDGGPNDLALETAVMGDFSGDGSNILDAAEVAIGQFAAPPAPLPAGPKAVILVTDGIDTHSTSTEGEVIDVANTGGIPIFTIGVGSPNQKGIDLLTNLALDTGGEFTPAPDDQAIAGAYASISLLLTNEYLISIDSAIADCAAHTLEVGVAGQAPPAASATFTRRECDTTPNAFSFTSQSGLDPSSGVRSNTVVIGGLEAPAPISITAGTYSIGCGDSGTFTGADGVIADGESVCVRQTTSSQVSTSKTTTLTIGGVSGTFTTTTRAQSGGGGGGGSTGLLELLLGLGVLLLRRHRQS